MSFRELAPGERLDAARGAVVVAIPVYGARELFTRCLESVARASPPGTRVLVADDASPDREIAAVARRIGEDAGDGLDVAYLRQPENGGFVRNANAAFAAAAPADVVLLNSDVEVPSGWLERLRAAAYTDALVATASTLTNNGTILSLPERDRPSSELPPGFTLEQAAAAVAAASPRLHPAIPTGIGHCLYIRRSALELVGGFDEAFSPGYGEEVDFSQRCIAHGLLHVVADDLYVLHHGRASFTEAGSPTQLAHERELNRRYPYYASAVQEAAGSDTIPLARSLMAGRLAFQRLSVTIDGASLGPYITGTQVLTLELIAALSRHGGVRLRVRIPRTIGEDASRLLERLEVERIFNDEATDGVRRDDVAHRPFQVVDPLDLRFLKRLGRRVVLTQQDVIAYRNPVYFADYEQWRGYRELTREVLTAVDRVVFSTDHTRREALDEDLVEASRSAVVPLGVDHHALTATTEAQGPAGAPADLAERGFLLCLGTDFQHKNRPFAMAVFAALRATHGFPGRLVLAGPHADHGTSEDEEAAWRAAHPAESEDVLDLGSVSEGVKAWLYANASLMLYPTAAEGFGLIPFEAAQAGLAPLWAAHSSLAEVLPAAAAGIVPWDVEATAARAAELLGEPGARDELVAAVRAAGERFTWDRYAERIVEVYREAAVAPGRALHDPADELTDLALSLVGPRGWLPPDVQRALLAVSARAALRKPVFSALRAGYQALYRARRVRAR